MIENIVMDDEVIRIKNKIEELEKIIKENTCTKTIAKANEYIKAVAELDIILLQLRRI